MYLWCAFSVRKSRVIVLIISYLYQDMNLSAVPDYLLDLIILNLKLVDAYVMSMLILFPLSLHLVFLSISVLTIFNLCLLDSCSVIVLSHLYFIIISKTHPCVLVALFPGLEWNDSNMEKNTNNPECLFLFVWAVFVQNTSNHYFQ